MKSMKKQKGEFVIGSMILLAIFLTIVTGSEMTSADREADLKAKHEAQTTEVSK